MNAIRPARTVVLGSPFEGLLEHFFAEPTLARAGGLEEGTLALDLSENETHVIVRASLPGFTREDIDVEVHDGVLTIKATHREESEESKERFYRRERRVSSLSRRVALPSLVREKDAAAELKDGVLTLRLPKTEQATPRKIRIG
jgi:HSP20 family protein